MTNSDHEYQPSNSENSIDSNTPLAKTVKKKTPPKKAAKRKPRTQNTKSKKQKTTPKQKTKRKRDIIPLNESDPIFTVRSCPHYIIEIVATLNERQRQLVNDIGFGSMMQIKMQTHEKLLFNWLLHNYKPGSRMLTVGTTSYQLTAEDVHDVFMLPKGDKEIDPKRGRKKIAEDEAKLRQDLKKQLGLPTGDVQNTQVARKIKENQLGNDDNFKRAFVIMCVSYFLAPTSNRQVDFSVAKAVADVNQIMEYDWCTFVLERLSVAIESYLSTENEKFQIIKPLHDAGLRYTPPSLTGCFHFLQTVYFHRLIFRGQPEPNETPLIKHWTDEKVSKRVELEKKDGFGMGLVRVTVNPQLEKILEDRPSDPQATPPNIQREEQIPSSLKSTGKKIKYEFDLPEGAETDEEIKSKYKKKMEQTLHFMKRDMHVFSSHYINKMLQMKQNPTSSQDEQPQEETDSESWWSDPDVHKAIDGVINRINEMKNMAFDMPTFQILTPTPPSPQTYSPQPAHTVSPPQEPQQQETETFTNVTMEIVHEITQTHSPTHQKQQMLETIFEAEETDQTPIPTPQQQQPQEKQQQPQQKQQQQPQPQQETQPQPQQQPHKGNAAVEQQTMDIIQYEPTQPLQIDPINIIPSPLDEEFHFLSSFLDKQKSALKKLGMEVQEIIDYCFNENLDN